MSYNKINNSEIQAIPILFCSSSKYIDQLIVTITSIIENNKDSYFVFYIFHQNFTEEEKKNFECFNNQKAKVIFKKINTKTLKEFKLTDEGRLDISLDTYSRFFAPLLITDYDKIIYLDSDIIVNANIKDLYQINIDGYLLGGVEERCLYQTDYISSYLNFSKDDLYINTGVLLMNLKKMRQEQFFKKILLESKNLMPFIKYSDQDILNILAKGKIKKIDCIYNMTTTHVKDLPSKRNLAKIIHYTGKFKPWTLGDSNNEMSSLYFEYYKKSKSYEKQKIKNFCIYHKNAYRFENELISPIQTGSYGLHNEMDMLQACEGDEIDYKNKNYGELSAWYWVWKNYLPQNPHIEYIGFCHYRRMIDYFNISSGSSFLKVITLNQFIDKYNNCYNDKEIYEIIKNYDIILPQKNILHSGETVEEQYLSYHPQKDLELLKQIIKKDYPDYVDEMNKVLSSKQAYYCLLFTMKTSLFIQFMNFSFDILFKLEKLSDWKKYNSYCEIRTPAYLIERFFNIWLLHNTKKYGWKILERDAYIFSEYIETSSDNQQHCTDDANKKQKLEYVLMHPLYFLWKKFKYKIKKNLVTGNKKNKAKQKYKHVKSLLKEAKKIKKDLIKL